MTQSCIRAVVFDMDGLLVDSEPYWEMPRASFCASRGCEWGNEDELSVKGHNSREWATRIKDRCNLQVTHSEVIDGVVRRVALRYRDHLPLLPGAVHAVEALAAHVPLGLASSSPRSLIQRVLSQARIEKCFAAIVSSDEAGRGKPAPDVFLLAAKSLKVSPEQVAVLEDSSSGIQAAKNAGMFVVAVPNAHYPPSQEALERADLVLDSLERFELGQLNLERFSNLSRDRDR